MSPVGLGGPRCDPAVFEAARGSDGDVLRVERSLTLGSALIAAGLLVAGISMPVLRYLDPRKAGSSFAFRLMLATLGWLGASVHLWVFDPLFRRRGRLKRLLGLPPGD